MPQTLIQQQMLTQTSISTPCSTWLSWLTATPQNDVYFLINTLSDPNPVKRFYAHDWIEEAFPIYHGTALAHLAEVSPWLVKVKRSQLFHLGKMLDSEPFSDPSWGWAYQSQLDWRTQITHWQKYQFAWMGEEKIIFRFFDARIARTLLPKLGRGDWALLMMPVEDCFIEESETKVIYSRPPYAEPFISPADYILSEALIKVWRNSEQAYINVIDNFYIQFWENHPTLADPLDEPEGRLIALIREWMDECQQKRLDTAHLFDDLFLRYLDEKGYLPDMTRSTNAVSV